MTDAAAPPKDTAPVDPWVLLPGARALLDAALETLPNAGDLDDPLMDEATAPAVLSPRPAPERLVAAMRYSLLAGGKRLRPLLVLAAARSVRDDDATQLRALHAALSVELVHTYSLIHDDLPSLDNDDLRRGRPSLHKATDEATAILAGDALLTDAFSVLASTDSPNAARMVKVLAAAAGSVGMVAGQVDDLDDEGPRSEPQLRAVHGKKTGRLLRASCVLGGLAAGAPAEVLVRLSRYGAHVGMAFQIMDDILDVTGDVRFGKGTGRDEKNHKATFVQVLGLDGARAQARAEVEAACHLVDATAENQGQRALLAVARYIVDRTH